MSTTDSNEFVTRKGKGAAFYPGHPRYGGTVKGSKQKFPQEMRNAIEYALTLCGQKKKDEKTGEFNQPGEGGIKGYMVHLALNNESLFCHAFASKLMPLLLEMGHEESDSKRLTEEEVIALCITYGIPFDRAADAEIHQPKMIDVTPELSDDDHDNTT
jgi:hypothetical protein